MSVHDEGQGWQHLMIDGRFMDDPPAPPPRDLWERWERIEQVLLVLVALVVNLALLWAAHRYAIGDGLWS